MTNTRSLGALLTAVLLVVSSPAAEPDDHTRLLDEVRDRHREALNTIRTVSFAFAWTELKNEPLNYKSQGVGGGGVGSSETGPGRYWQTPERWRSSALWSGAITVDEVYRHHAVLTLRKPSVDFPPRPTTLTREQATPWTRNGRDRLAQLLLGHDARDTFSCIPFHQLLEQPHTLHAVERLTATNEVRVELSHADERYEFWFGPKHNHLIRKRVWYPANEPQHHNEIEVTQFAEPNPGQFFPAVVESRWFDEEGLKLHGRQTLTELQVNRPISNDVFRLPGIDGMMCKDSTYHRSFRVDADGYRVGEFVPDEMPPRPRSAPGVAPPTGGQSDGELPWWAWAVIAALLLCLIAAVMEIRRLRTPPPPTPPR